MSVADPLPDVVGTGWSGATVVPGMTLGLTGDYGPAPFAFTAATANV